jgi:hypothetical protein
VRGDRLAGVDLDPVRGGEIAAGLLARLLARLGRGCRLTLEGIPVPGGVRLEARTSGLAAEERAALEREVGAWLAVAEPPIGGPLPGDTSAGWWVRLPCRGGSGGAP